jgi:Na+/phosphate symporter
MGFEDAKKMNLSNKEKEVLIELLNMAIDIENNSDEPSKEYFKTVRQLINKLGVE